MAFDADGDLGKLVDFNDVYDGRDPRAYFHRLGDLAYAVPQLGQAVFRRVLDALGVERPRVVDLCCSYGVNAALMKHDLELRDLYEHYRSDYVADLWPTELADLDRQFFARSRIESSPVVVGVDSAANAVDYAVKVGLVDIGAVENLELAEPSAELTALVADTDLIAVTGGIGYITDVTFDRLLGCCSPDRPPWVAALCLRTVPFEAIAACLDRHGLVLERVPGVTLPQRAFADDLERSFALGQLAELGIDPEGHESDGLYYVNVFLARPAAAIEDARVDEVLYGLAESGSASWR